MPLIYLPLFWNLDSLNSLQYLNIQCPQKSCMKERNSWWNFFLLNGDIVLLEELDCAKKNFGHLSSVSILLAIRVFVISVSNHWLGFLESLIFILINYFPVCKKITIVIDFIINLCIHIIEIAILDTEMEQF